MVVCGELLTKMVEPLVSLPPSDSLFPPGGNGNGRDGGTSSATFSPLPDTYVHRFLKNSFELDKLLLTGNLHCRAASLLYPVKVTSFIAD